MSKRAGVPDLQGTVSVGKTLSGPHLQGTTHMAGWKTTPFFLRRRPIYLAWRFSIEKRFQVSHTSRGQGGTLKEWNHGETPSLHTYWPHFSWSRHPRKGLMHLSGALLFATVAQETPPDVLVWRLTGITIDAQKECVYLHTLNAAAYGYVYNQHLTRC